MKANKFILQLSCLLCFVVAESCYYDKEDLLYGASDCDISTVSFREDILPIVGNSCATVGCHVQGGSGPSIYENYDQVKAAVDKGSLNQRVVVQMDMPPSGSLTACQIAHVQQWILDGAPNN